MHTDLPSAVTVCDASAEKIDLFGDGGTTDACLKAFKAGQDAGKYGPNIPAAARGGLVREFDKRLAACKDTNAQTKTRDTFNLGD